MLHRRRNYEMRVRNYEMRVRNCEMRVISAEPPCCNRLLLPPKARRAISPNYFERRERADYTTPEDSLHSWHCQWTTDCSTSATEHGGSAAMELGTTERYGSHRRRLQVAVRPAELAR